jgi:hypothetical protein
MASLAAATALTLATTGSGRTPTTMAMFQQHGQPGSWR